MKKRILIFALSLTWISYSFANKVDDSINKRAVASFNSEFRNASDVKWERHNGFVVATFSINNQVAFAYYNSDGELLAIARNILSDKLPIMKLLSLKKDYSHYWISDLIEVSKGEGVSYYITVENAEEKITLKSAEAGNWEAYSKEEKK
jgi:hypothetical protein